MSWDWCSSDAIAHCCCCFFRKIEIKKAILGVCIICFLLETTVFADSAHRLDKKIPVTREIIGITVALYMIASSRGCLQQRNPSVAALQDEQELSNYNKRHHIVRILLLSSSVIPILLSSSLSAQAQTQILRLACTSLFRYNVRRTLESGKILWSRLFDSLLLLRGLRILDDAVCLSC
jgi:hypothetical protein